MTKSIQIEPVCDREHSKAMKFLAGGASHSASVDARGLSLEKIFSSQAPGTVRLWEARREQRRVAVAMVTQSSGRKGKLFYSPTTAPQVHRKSLAELVLAITRESIRGGLSLVQALILPSAKEDIAMLSEAGFALLAELINMRLDLPNIKSHHQEDPRGLTWKSYKQLSESELGELISSTYKDSLDCPGLSDVRKMKDVITGHKANGIFNPQCWWIVERDAHPAGCILANYSTSSCAINVVYLGIVPEHRGESLSKIMLRRLAAYTHNQGVSALTLGVDARNHYAIGNYQALSFRETTRGFAYFMTHKMTSNAKK